MNAKTKSILDKVRALLSKTVENGASEAEAEQALIMAEKLMAEYNIQDSDIYMSKGDISVENILNTAQGHERVHWQWDLLQIIGSGYNCRVWRSEKFSAQLMKWVWVYEIYGFPEDREMVKSLYEMLIPIIRSLKNTRRREYKAANKGKKISCESTFFKSYIEGFMKGLNVRLQAARKEIFFIPEQSMKYELMVVKKDALLEEWLDEKFPDAKPANIRKQEKLDKNAFISGYKDGQEETMQNKLT